MRIDLSLVDFAKTMQDINRSNLLSSFPKRQIGLQRLTLPQMIVLLPQRNAPSNSSESRSLFRFFTLTIFASLSYALPNDLPRFISGLLPNAPANLSLPFPSNPSLSPLTNLSSNPLRCIDQPYTLGWMSVMPDAPTLNPRNCRVAIQTLYAQYSGDMAVTRTFASRARARAKDQPPLPAGTKKLPLWFGGDESKCQ